MSDNETHQITPERRYFLAYGVEDSPWAETLAKAYPKKRSAVKINLGMSRTFLKRRKSRRKKQAEPVVEVPSGFAIDHQKISVPLTRLECKSSWKGPELHNELYYLNFFQYRSGDLYRAILGREVVYDREWEEEAVVALDRLLSSPKHSCKAYLYRGKHTFNVRGRFWKWNDWLKRRPECSMLFRPGVRNLIYVRRIDDRVDIEGKISMATDRTKWGVMTLTYRSWVQDYEPLFKEVALENDSGYRGSKYSAYYGRTDPRPKPPAEWLKVEHFKFKADEWGRFKFNTAATPNGVKRNADLVHRMREAHLRAVGEETAKSVRALSALLRDCMVPQSWRVLKDFRGASLEEWNKNKPNSACMNAPIQTKEDVMLPVQKLNNFAWGNHKKSTDDFVTCRPEDAVLSDSSDEFEIKPPKLS